MLSLSEGVSSSYSCPGSSCPAQFSHATLVPGNVYLGPGDTATERPQEVDCDTNYNCTPPFTPYVTSWEVTDLYGAVEYYNNGDTMGLLGLNGGTASIRANIGYERYYWEETTSSCQDEGMDTEPVEALARTIHLDSVSPGRGVISATTHVILTGTNFNSGTTINLGGGGVTVTNKTVNSSTSITADFVVASNASGGNHSVSVTVNGKTSNSKNFYVQVPTKLLPYNHTLAPNGIGPLHTPVNQPLERIDGTAYPAPYDHICGVFRHYLFYLADQDNPAQEIVNRPFTLDEIFTNYSGAFSTPTFVPPTIGAGEEIGDIQSLFLFGNDCLQPGENEQFDQQFKITFGGHAYFPSTTIHISRGNFAGTLKIDRTITTP